MTIEEMKSVDIRTVKTEDVIDINSIKIDDRLTEEEKRLEFVRQIKNPYCFRIGNVIVKSTYSDNGVTLNERFEELVLSL